jgi:ketosteroid isomerase-like protein
MSENVEIVRRLFRAVEEREVEPMFEIYDPEVVIREARSLPYGGEHHGHEGMVNHGLGYVGTWGPLQASDERRLEPGFFHSGDHVFVRWRQKARGSNGETLDLPALSVYRLEEGKVIESEMYQFDTAAILRFLDRAGTSDGGASTLGSGGS